LLKAKFTGIKEAYEVLSDPIKRKKYDLSFDNLSYKKEVSLTPFRLLQKVKELRLKISKLDPNRMDLDKLEFEITELLSERNTDTLLKSDDRQMVQQFIGELMETARPLSPRQLEPVIKQVLPLADKATGEKLKAFVETHTWDNRWNTYKIVLALAAGILLCILIYLTGNHKI
jgi:hypothetical protein